MPTDREREKLVEELEMALSAVPLSLPNGDVRLMGPVLAVGLTDYRDDRQWARAAMRDIAVTVAAVAEAVFARREAEKPGPAGWRVGYAGDGWVLVRPDGMLLWNSRYRPSEEELQQIVDTMNAAAIRAREEGA